MIHNFFKYALRKIFALQICFLWWCSSCHGRVFSAILIVTWLIVLEGLASSIDMVSHVPWSPIVMRWISTFILKISPVLPDSSWSYLVEIVLFCNEGVRRAFHVSFLYECKDRYFFYRLVIVPFVFSFGFCQSIRESVLYGYLLMCYLLTWNSLLCWMTCVIW